jgi:hypothetical protein
VVCARDSRGRRRLRRGGPRSPSGRPPSAVSGARATPASGCRTESRLRGADATGCRPLRARIGCRVRLSESRSRNSRRQGAFRGPNGRLETWFGSRGRTRNPLRARRDGDRARFRPSALAVASRLTVRAAAHGHLRTGGTSCQSPGARSRRARRRGRRRGPSGSPGSARAAPLRDRGCAAAAPHPKRPRRARAAAGAAAASRSWGSRRSRGARPCERARCCPRPPVHLSQGSRSRARGRRRRCRGACARATRRPSCPSCGASAARSAASGPWAASGPRPRPACRRRAA